jgi:25S rRNA (adenine2142-N1)-methyltransferase
VRAPTLRRSFAMKKKKSKRVPVTLQNVKFKIKSTQKLISNFHLLQKKLLTCKDDTELELVNEEIASLGGLEVYQIASLKGSKKNNSQKFLVDNIESSRRYSLLDVGAITGEIYTNKLFDVTAIDFFERPIPSDENGKFDIISLCLVLNYVPTPDRRGEMLQLCACHLKLNGILYIVVPLPCISNSRYFNHEKMVELLMLLGYDLLKHHDSKKLAFYLFKRTKDITTLGTLSFKKRLLKNDGPGKNNFTMTLN